MINENMSVRAVVAASDLKIAEQLREFLDMFGYETVADTCYGFECVSAVGHLKPDIVLADAYLYDFDILRTFDLLKQNGSLGSTVFVVASAVSDSSLINKILQSGIDSFVLMPTDLFALDNSIRNLILEKQGKQKNGQDDAAGEFEIITHTKKLMHKLGIYASIQGYTHILNSVLLVLKDRTYLSSITKRLYPTLAQMSGTSVSAVERSMRHAIEKVWQNGNLELIEEIFGYTVSPNRDKSSNGQFISMLTERVKTDLKLK